MDTGELEASTSKCGSVEAELSRQQQLVARLEDDLLAAEQRHSNPGEASADAFDGLGSAGPSGLLDDGMSSAETHKVKSCVSASDQQRPSSFARHENALHGQHCSKHATGS